jgi:flagellar protein FliS
MSNHAGDSYFATQVLTAPPHKLQRMLLEGALRHGRRAEQLLAAGHHAAGDEALIRSQEIMAELIASLRPELAPELVRKVASVYVFVHRLLISAQTRHDLGKLREALSLLELECETWRQVCHQVDGSALATMPEAEPRVPRLAFADPPAAANSLGVSFEA